RTRLWNSAAGQPGVFECLFPGFPVLRAETLRRYPGQAGTVLDDPLDAIPMFVDGRSPARFPFLRLVFPFDQMQEDDLEIALNTAAIALPQALDLLGDILPVDMGRAQRAQALGLVL